MKRKVLSLFSAALATVMICGVSFGSTPAYLDESQDIEVRVRDALSRMTLSEKIGLVHAQSKFSSAGVQRLGIPEIWCTDGPHGIRSDVLWDEWIQAGQTNDSCVAFPALTCLAATWNPEISRLYGKAVGEEARYRNKSVLLGPGVNIYRTPLNGRNFEYMGEDPFLAAQMVVPYVKGVQENGVAACLKHFALNNQERDRHLVNVTVDDRTLHEIYLPAFKAAIVNGGAWTVMPGYNKYNGDYACLNRKLLLDILKGDWKFDGVTISDWGAVHETEKAASNGLDIEFGSWTNGLNWGASNAYDDYFLAKPYEKLIKEGKLPESDLDDKASRVLRLIFRTAMNRNRPFGSLNSEEHYDVARKVAGEGIVLLKNDRKILPVRENIRKILIVGENAIKMLTVGGGSSSLKAQREVLAIDGLREMAARKGISVDYERGYVGDVTGEYNGVTSGQNLKDDRTPGQLIEDAVAKAKDADLVIFVGGLNKSDGQDAEGDDRKDFGLPYGQDKVIEALAEANDNLVFVGFSGNAYAMPWKDKVPAIVQSWYLGSETGNALADVLFGEVNPSGRLPFTFAKDLTDYAPHSFGDSLIYPGARNEVLYKEGLGVGYRHTDKLKKRVNFAFGHGLSYTDFTLGRASVTGGIADGGSFDVTVPVTNTGDRAGAEVVQLYISGPKDGVERPLKELKAFGKIYLDAGASGVIRLNLDRNAFAFYNADKGLWQVNPGNYKILIGTASDKILQTLPVNLNIQGPINWHD